MLLLLPMAASAEKVKVIYKDGRTIYYEVEGSNAYVISSPDGYSRTLRIPSDMLESEDKIINLETGEIGWLDNYGFQGIYERYIMTEVRGFADNALDGCTDLTSIIITNGRKFRRFPNGIFKDCNSLTQIEIGQYNLPLDGDLYSPNGSVAVVMMASQSGDVLVAGCKNTKIPSCVKTIGSKAFYGYKNLTEITIPGNVKTIGSQAFAETGLKKITISEGVETIESQAFEGTRLTELTIPSSVREIGGGAFRNCTNLQSVTIFGNANGTYFWRGSTGKSSYEVFDGCTNLSSVTVKSGNIYYNYNDSSPFVGCPTLTEVNLEEGVEEIGNCFRGCTGLTSLKIPNSAKYVNGFDGCTGLKSVTIGGDNISIGSFANCTALTDVIIEEGKKIFVGSPFYGCTNLSTFTVRGPIDNNANGIGLFLFKNASIPNIHISDVNVWCNSNIGIVSGEDKFCRYHLFLNGKEVEHLKIPEGVTTICDGAFIGCISLKSVTLPNSLKSIGGNVFYCCDNLLLVFSPMENPCAFGGDSDWGIDEYYTNNPNGNTVISSGDDYYVVKKDLLTAYVPIGRLSVYENTTGWNKFPNLLTWVPVESIDPEEFYPGPNHHHTVIFKANSYTIEYGDELPAFEYTKIGANVSGTPSISCEATKNSPVGTYPIVISKGSVTETSASYINGTLTITKAPLTIKADSYKKEEGEANPVFNISYEGFKNNETQAVLTKQPTVSCSATEDSPAGEYEITVSGAEAQNYEITYVSGKLVVTAKDDGNPDSPIVFLDPKVKEICLANWDTNNDQQLSKAEAAAVTSLGTMFKWNNEISSFDELKYFTGLTTIENSAFEGCSSLEDVNIPNGVTTIGEEAFYNCTNLGTITIPSTVTSIGDYAIENCEKLTKVNISDVAAWCGIEFGSWANPLEYAHCLFLNGEEVTNLVIPEGVTSIGHGAFKRCSGLVSISIPNSVTSIGNNAFWGCNGLISIYSYIDELFEISMVFDIPTLYNQTTLYVPIGKVDAYRNTNQWRNFKYIVEMVPFKLGDANGDGEVDQKDIEAIADYIVTGNIENFIFNNANVNGDNVVNAADIVELITRISNQQKD